MCGFTLSTLPVQELSNFPVGIHLRRTLLKILPVSFHLRQDLGFILFSGTVVVFLFENLCPVGICLSGFLDALDFSTGIYILHPYSVQRHEDLTLRGILRRIHHDLHCKGLTPPKFTQRNIQQLGVKS
ncbi:hypothetical protein Tco_0423567 [Tanacetum coccineum]